MKKPFQKDIAFLKEELVHHEYISRKFSQECDNSRAAEFEILCTEIRTALEIMEERQATAISEWTALAHSERQTILNPLFDALEHTVTDMQKHGCPEFAASLYSYLGDYLIDLAE